MEREPENSRPGGCFPPMEGPNRRGKSGFRSGSLGSSICLQSIGKVKHMVDTVVHYVWLNVSRVLFDPAESHGIAKKRIGRGAVRKPPLHA